MGCGVRAVVEQRIEVSSNVGSESWEAGRVRAQRRRRVVEGCRDGFDAHAEDLFEQIVFGIEVVVDGAGFDSGRSGDAPQCCLGVALIEEETRCGVEDPLTTV